MPSVLVMPRLAGSGLDRSWRRIATGGCFLLFAFCALTVGLGIAPLLKLASPDRAVSQRRVRRVVGLACRGFVTVLRGLGLIDYRLVDGERLRHPGRLVLANHPSLIDALFLLAYTPNAGCIVKGRLARHPVTRHVIQSAGFIANRNPRRVIAEACRALENGQSLIVFPEGTRSTPGKPIRLRRGGAIIAFSSGAAITPVRIRCEPSTLVKGIPWYRVAPRKPCFRLEIGEAMIPAEAETTLQATRDLNRRLEAYFNTFLMDEDVTRVERPGT
ncbi:1-acyl-sn-glycerol-3-phosphate acyltransferases [Modicisalibacter ilicicola DSM 19980]|uniref:1-acyl-sn-glycerol-3-phosphate acyltransferases n=1 Tax=Modicisalibacter ilicicola DSM 19980 TaxID=1121942 RepID=A0A1M4ZT85_9GAMM|nr:lysophospholipid acyltransferase family protein [Halomonas ilicicola]SHF21273.1 1-acyl-sn-glycerol-3-phosphate acyltransferases [Halomonas ilicicola DSM 19980]